MRRSLSRSLLTAAVLTGASLGMAPAAQAVAFPGPGGIGVPIMQAQTINFSSVPPSPATVGDPDYAVSAWSTSGLVVSFSLDATSTGCTLTQPNTITFTGEGTCKVNATQNGDAVMWAPAPSQQQSISVIAASAPELQTQSITFVAPEKGVVGESDDLTASASSALPVTFAVTDASAEVASCHIVGSTVYYDNPGSCGINADQGGDSTYAAAATVQQTITVLAAQTITFTTLAPGFVGGQDVPNATSDSGGFVSFSLDPDSADVCTLNVGGDLTQLLYNAPGDCTIYADQAGDSTYAPAPQVHQTVRVSCADVGSDVPDGWYGQCITFTTPEGREVGDQDTLTALGGGSGNPVTFSVDGDASDICHLTEGSVLHYDAVGDCVVQADQIGDDKQFADAPQVTRSIAVSPSIPKLPQTISFADPGPGIVGRTADLVVSGGDSGLPVVLTVDRTSDAGVCSLKGLTLTYLAPGSCVVLATQAGNTGFAPAAPVLRTIAVTAPVAGTPPLIVAEVTSGKPAKNGWYRTPVTVTFRCTPGFAPLVGPCPAPVVLNDDGKDQSVTRSIADTAGLTASATGGPIAIDRHGPAVRAAGVSADHVYLTGPLLALRCVAVDALSGVDACTLIQRRQGNAVVVTSRAMDRAGNSTTTVVRYYQASFLIEGARFVHSAYQLQAGHRYTVLILDPSGQHHGLFAPVPRGTEPSQLVATRPTGQPDLWSMQLTITPEMAGQRHWTLTRPSWEIQPRLYFDVR